jgi:hypothetical protein
VAGNKHDVESEGSKPRDHEHSRHSFWRAPHKSPLLWIAVIIMLAGIIIYVVTVDFSVRPASKQISPPTPAAP